MRVCGCVLLLAVGVGRLQAAPTVQQPSADAVLGRATGYVAQFTKAFSAVIWHERYEQEDRLRRKFNASGGSFSLPAARRQLDSELLSLWLPREAAWIAVRDVIAVDGKAMPGGLPVSR